MSADMHIHPARTRPGRGQSGAALVVSLVLLAVLTILGVSSMQQGTLQERMTGNVRNKQIALQAAEAALRDGEDYLDTTSVPGPFDGNDGLYPPADAGDPPRWEQVDWSDSDAVRAYPMPNVARDPTYIIEKLPNIAFGNPQMAGDEPIPGGAVYRITARGTGLAGEADLMAQTTYRRD